MLRPHFYLLVILNQLFINISNLYVRNDVKLYIIKKGGYMRHKQFILCAVLFFEFGLIGLHAQEAISSAGGNTSAGGQGSLSYSVGQVVYITVTGTTGSILQGVQQPYEISVINGIEETRDINLLVSAYPNPTNDHLMLRVDNSEVTNLSFELYDTSERLLDSGILSENENLIDMSRFMPAIYFLKVTENNKEIKTFRIIKN